jgi:hypothetical protein
MFPTTFDTETEISSLNSILGCIGQAPVTTLDYKNPETAMIARTIQEVSNQVQSEGWVFNTETEYPFAPDSTNQIKIPNNVIELDTSAIEGPGVDVIKRQGKLYDKISHSYDFQRPVRCDVVWKFDFEDLPHPFKQYITYRAARIVAAKLTVDKELYLLLQEQEGIARAVCQEYECNQGDYNYLGYPSGTRGNNYRPYQALIR